MTIFDNFWIFGVFNELFGFFWIKKRIFFGLFGFVLIFGFFLKFFAFLKHFFGFFGFFLVPFKVTKVTLKKVPCSPSFYVKT